jgi:hypothetical protein
MLPALSAMTDYRWNREVMLCLMLLLMEPQLKEWLGSKKGMKPEILIMVTPLRLLACNYIYFHDYQAFLLQPYSD